MNSGGSERFDPVNSNSERVLASLWRMSNSAAFPVPNCKLNVGISNSCKSFRAIGNIESVKSNATLTADSRLSSTHLDGLGL